MLIDYELVLCDEVGGTTDREQIILLGLIGDALRSPGATGRVLEIGTFRGHSSQAIAINYPDCAITTIDLPEGHKPSLPDIPAERPYYGVAHQRSVITAPNVRRLYMDTAKIDSAWIGREGWRQAFDVVYIDGGHSLPQVLHDTMMALECVRRYGLIVWHDYGEPYLETVSRVVDCFSLLGTVTAYEGTRLASLRTGGGSYGVVA